MTTSTSHPITLIDFEDQKLTFTGRKIAEQPGWDAYAADDGRIFDCTRYSDPAAAQHGQYAAVLGFEDFGAFHLCGQGADRL